MVFEVTPIEFAVRLTDTGGLIGYIAVPEWPEGFSGSVLDKRGRRVRAGHFNTTMDAE